MTSAPEKRPAFEMPVQLIQAEHGAADMPRPGSTVAGGLLVLLRVVAGVLFMIVVALDWDQIITAPDFGGDPLNADLTPDVSHLLLAAVLVVLAVPMLFDAVFAFLILQGRNWPRVVVMFVSVLSTSTAFVTWVAGGNELHVDTTLLPVALDVLILLALSSRSAAAYARRRQRRPESAEG